MSRPLNHQVHAGQVIRRQSCVHEHGRGRRSHLDDMRHFYATHFRHRVIGHNYIVDSRIKYGECALCAWYGIHQVTEVGEKPFGRDAAFILVINQKDRFHWAQRCALHNSFGLIGYPRACHTDESLIEVVQPRCCLQGGAGQGGTGVWLKPGGRTSANRQPGPYRVAELNCSPDVPAKWWRQRAPLDATARSQLASAGSVALATPVLVRGLFLVVRILAVERFAEPGKW